MKATETSEEAVGKGLTLKAVVLGSAIVIIATWFFITSYFTRAMWGPSGGYSTYIWSGHANNPVAFPFALCFLVMLLITAINKYKKIFRLQEVVIIYTMIWVGFSAGQGYSAIPEFLGSYPAGVILAENTDLLWEFITPMFGPKDISAYDGVFEFGASVPWGAWATAMAWNIGYILSAMLFMIFLTTTLARRIYVDVESLPFPFATEGTRIVEATQLATGGGVNYLTSKLFWIGIAITMLWGAPALPGIIQSTVPSPPFNRDYFNMFSQDFTAGAAAGALGWFGLWTQITPNVIGFGTWMPLDILSGFIVFWFAINLLPVFFSAGGYWPASWPGKLSAGRVNKLFMQGYYPLNWQPVMYGSAIIFGSAAALAIWPLITLRHEIAPMLKSLWQRPPREVDAREPIPSKYLVIGTIVCALLWLAFGMASSMTWWMMLLAIGASALFYLGGARFRGETGGLGWQMGSWTCHWGPGCLWYLMLYAVIAAFGMYNPNMATSTAMIVLLWGGPLGYMWFSHGSLTTASATPLESYKMGALTKTGVREIFTATVLAAVIAIVTSAISFVGWLYYLDWSGIPGYTALSGALRTQGVYFNLWSYSNPDVGVTYNTPLLTTPDANYGETIVFFAGAFAVVIILYILRGRGNILGSWLHPVGLMLAATTGYFWWASLLIAFAIKFVTIKVGGVELYKSKLAPLATGLVVGGALIFFLYAVFHQLHALGFYGAPIG